MILTYLLWVLMASCSAFLMLGTYSELLAKIYVWIAMGSFCLLKFFAGSKRPLRDLLERTGLNGAIFFFLLIALLSTIFGISPGQSQETFFGRYLTYFFMFFVGAFLGKSRERVNILALALLAGSMIVGIGTIVDLAQAGHYSRTLTSFGLQIYAAYYLYAMSFFVGFVVICPSLKKKIFYMAAAMPILIAFFAQGSRGVFLGMFFAVLAVSFFCYADRRCFKGLVSIAIILLLFLPLNSRRFFCEEASLDIAVDGAGVSKINTENANVRLQMWEAAKNIFRQYPILGAGPDSYGTLMYDFYAGEIEGGRIHLHAHNTYFEVLAEMGLAGLLSFLWIFVLFFKKAYTALCQRKGVYQLSFLIMLVAVAICDLFVSTVLVGFTSAVAFWFLLGLGASSVEHQEGGCSCP